jgi:hypothetical protein
MAQPLPPYSGCRPVGPNQADNLSKAAAGWFIGPDPTERGWEVGGTALNGDLGKGRWQYRQPSGGAGISTSVTGTGWRAATGPA